MKKTYFIVLVIILILVAAGVYFLVQPKANQNQQNSSSYQIQGMKVEILKQGTGVAAKAGDTVSVGYIGTLQDGTVFDSAGMANDPMSRAEPFPFTLGQNSVIQGWELGVLGMKVGEKRKLTIPPELAYGNQSVGGVIPANSTLIFEVDLLSINGK